MKKTLIIGLGLATISLQSCTPGSTIEVHSPYTGYTYKLTNPVDPEK